MEVVGLDLLTNPAMSSDSLPHIDTFDLPDYEYNNGILTIINYKHGTVISAPVAV